MAVSIGRTRKDGLIFDSLLVTHVTFVNQILGFRTLFSIVEFGCVFLTIRQFPHFLPEEGKNSRVPISAALFAADMGTRRP